MHGDWTLTGANGENREKFLCYLRYLLFSIGLARCIGREIIGFARARQGAAGDFCAVPLLTFIMPEKHGSARNWVLGQFKARRQRFKQMSNTSEQTLNRRKRS